MNRPEQKLHIAVAQFLRVAWPADLLWFHCPNGGARSKPEAALLKVMGTLPGIPDLLFVMPNGQLAAIELKAADGQLSEAQIDVKLRLQALHCGYQVCRTLDDVEATLTRWLGAYGRELQARTVARAAA